MLFFWSISVLPLKITIGADPTYCFPEDATESLRALFRGERD